MPKQSPPTIRAVNQAADRLYLKAVDLIALLNTNPVGTLHSLSVSAELFGTVKPALDAMHRRRAIERVIAAAEAYVAARQIQGGNEIATDNGG